MTGFFDEGAIFGGVCTAEFRISEKLNDNSPVAVEILVLYDADLEKEIVGLTARQWFAARERYRKDYSLDDYEGFLWEWTPTRPPSSTLPPPGEAWPPPQSFSFRAGALSAIVFADYDRPGDHRVRVEPPDQNLLVLLRADHFLVRPLR